MAADQTENIGVCKIKMSVQVSFSFQFDIFVLVNHSENFTSGQESLRP